MDSATVRAAIAQVKPDVSSETAWFESDIPDEALQAAIGKYAHQATDETPLALISSVASSKAGFLFTDKALYFGEVMGVVPMRMEYDDITALSRDRKFLKFASDERDVEWNLTDTLLWEKSRKKLADVVVPILQAIIGQDDSAPAEDNGPEKPEQATVSRPKKSVDVQIEKIDPIDWPKVLWFQLPIALLGIPLVMPGVFWAIALLGIGGSDFTYMIDYELDYGQLLVLSASALVPTMYAFGTTLQFSFGRFLVAVAIIAFVTLRALVSAAPSGGGAFPVTFGGGILGIGVAGGLGFAGLAVRNWLQTGRGK